MQKKKIIEKRDKKKERQNEYQKHKKQHKHKVDKMKKKDGNKIDIYYICGKEIKYKQRFFNIESIIIIIRD